MSNFSFSHRVFKKLISQGASKGVIVWEWVKEALSLDVSPFQSFENLVGKGEIACNGQFLLFPQCFIPVWRTVCHFHQIWNCCLQTLSVWKSLKFVVWDRVKFVQDRMVSNMSSFTLFVTFKYWYSFSEDWLNIRSKHNKKLMSYWEWLLLLVSETDPCVYFRISPNKRALPNSSPSRKILESW